MCVCVRERERESLCEHIYKNRSNALIDMLLEHIYMLLEHGRIHEI